MSLKNRFTDVFIRGLRFCFNTKAYLFLQKAKLAQYATRDRVEETSKVRRLRKALVMVILKPSGCSRHCVDYTQRAFAV